MANTSAAERTPAAADTHAHADDDDASSSSSGEEEEEQAFVHANLRPASERTHARRVSVQAACAWVRQLMVVPAEPPPALHLPAWLRNSSEWWRVCCSVLLCGALLCACVSIGVHIALPAAPALPLGELRGWTAQHPAQSPPFTVVSLLRDMPTAEQLRRAHMSRNDTDSWKMIVRHMHISNLKRNHAQHGIQWNALSSWLRVTPARHILVFMDTQESCTRLTNTDAFADAQCFVVPCWHPVYRKPLLDCIFHAAHAHARTELIAFVNGDIVLDAALPTAVQRTVEELPDRPFMLVSRRRNVRMPGELFERYAHPSNVDAILQHAREASELDGYFAIDLMLYPKHVLSLLNFDPSMRARLYADIYPGDYDLSLPAGVTAPRAGAVMRRGPKVAAPEALHFAPFLAGVWRWDNWWLSQMILQQPSAHSVVVVDASAFELLVHQDSPTVSAALHEDRPGSAWNEELVERLLGDLFLFGSMSNAHVRFQGDCAPNDVASASGEPCRLYDNPRARERVPFALQLAGARAMEYALAAATGGLGVALLVGQERQSVLQATCCLFASGTAYFIAAMMRDGADFIAVFAAVIVGGTCGAILRTWCFSERELVDSRGLLSLMGACSGVTVWTLLQSLLPVMLPNSWRVVHKSALRVVMMLSVALVGAGIGGCFARISALVWPPLLGSFLLLQSVSRVAGLDFNALRLLTAEGARACHASPSCWCLHVTFVIVATLGTLLHARRLATAAQTDAGQAKYTQNV